MRKTEYFSNGILRWLGQERRRVFGAWRALLLCNRVASDTFRFTLSQSDFPSILRELITANQIEAIHGVTDVYLVITPFSDVVPVTEEQMIQEANPQAVFSHLTAMTYHNLTDQIPRQIQVTQYRSMNPERIPLGTSPEEWVSSPTPPLHRPKQAGNIGVRWFVTKGEWDFGHTVMYSQGLPVYVTDLERTLIDILRAPDESGGIVHVLRAWQNAKERWSLTRLLDHTERMGQAILRQRVGYLLEQLGVGSPRLELWKAKTTRGSSAKLVASEPFSSVHSAEWDLSLNVPDEALAELEDE